MRITVACAISLNGCLGTQPDTFESLLNDTVDQAPDWALLQALRSKMTGIIMGNNTYKAFPKAHPVNHDKPLTHVILTHSGHVDRDTPLFQQSKHPVLVAKAVNPENTPKPDTSKPKMLVDLQFNDMPDLMRQLKLSHPQGDWLVEGGGQVVQAFMDAQIVNEFHLTVCPVWLQDGIPLFHKGWENAGGWQVKQVIPFTHAVTIIYHMANAR